MGIETNVRCDACRQLKGETNHWLIVVTPKPDAVYPLEGIAFGTFDSHVNDPDLRVEHICGQACAHKRLDAWLSGLTHKESEEQ